MFMITPELPLRTTPSYVEYPREKKGGFLMMTISCYCFLPWKTTVNFTLEIPYKFSRYILPLKPLVKFHLKIPYKFPKNILPLKRLGNFHLNPSL